jgi:hypothetical protein
VGATLTAACLGETAPPTCEARAREEGTMIRQWIAMVSAGLILVAHPGPRADAQISRSLSFEEIEEIAKNAYIYGLQQVVFYETRYVFTQLESSPAYVGVNRLAWLRQPITPEAREVVTPNATTLYGSGFFDLSEEPLVVELPAIRDRYYSFQAMDQYGDFFFYAGNQFTGTDAQEYILVGPSWTKSAPDEFDGTQIIASPSDTGFMIVRMALMQGTEDEVRTLNGYQDDVTTTPLSHWEANGRKGVSYEDRERDRASYRTFPRMADLTQALVESQTGMDYFQLLSLCLNDPTMTKRDDSLQEARTLHELVKIGLREGLLFDPAALEETQKAALESGFDVGRTKVKTATRTSLTDMNGWMLTKGMGNFGTDYLSRAVIADAGWAGPEEKSHNGAFCFEDSAGRQLNGELRYTLTFFRKNLPPVTQFWSIPIYDIEGYFVANAIDRYTVNSFMYDRGEFQVDNRGLLTFYIQKERPTDRQRAKNWLPAPDGDFRLVARFYGPKAPLIDGTYDMPQPVRAD